MLIGTVSDVRIAPDNKHVDAVLSLEGKEARRLGLGKPAPDLRTQLGSQGITGVKYVDIDFFDPKDNPVAAMPFPIAEHVIPSAPSQLKTMLDSALAALRSLEKILDDVGGQQLPARIAKAIDDADGAVSDLRGLLASLDRAKLPENMAAAVAKMNGVLDSLGGEKGLVASTQELGRTTTSSVQNLDRTLRDIDEAAQAVRELAGSIERRPDMLVKGGRVKKEQP